MSSTIHLYRWEDDPDGELALSLLQEKGLDHEDHILDPEVPNSAPSVLINKKMHTIDQLLDMLDKGEL